MCESFNSATSFISITTNSSVSSFHRRLSGRNPLGKVGCSNRFQPSRRGKFLRTVGHAYSSKILPSQRGSRFANGSPLWRSALVRVLLHPVRINVNRLHKAVHSDLAAFHHAGRQRPPLPSRRGRLYRYNDWGLLCHKQEA